MILGAIPGATPDKWAARWRQRFPQHALDIQYYDAAGQLERICAGIVDIGYVRWTETPEEFDPGTFHRVLLYREDPVVCAAAEHWIAGAEDSVDVAELSEETFWEPAQLLPDAAEPGAGERMALEVAASGAGLAVLPQSVARMLSRKDVVVRTLTGADQYETSLAWLRERDSEVIQEFVGIARGRKAESARSSLGSPSSPSARSPKVRKKAPARPRTSGRVNRPTNPGRARKHRRR